MHRLSILILAVAAACGGSNKPVQTAPLPEETKPTQPTPPPPVAETKPATPPPPAGPVEVKIPAMTTTVKLVSGGKGKKEQIRYALKAGTKQSLELSMDFAGKQDTDAQIVPTIVLAAEAETKAVDKDSAEYLIAVTGADAREVAGSQIPVDKFKQVLGTLSGLTIGGKLSATGVAGDVTLHMENPPAHASDALELIRVTLPRVPVLPNEAVGVGAKWQTTTTMKLADRLDVTQTTDYEVVSHKGPTWTIKGTTKIAGKDQEIEQSKVSEITGSGSTEATVTSGALFPTFKNTVETQFKAADKDHAVTFSIKIGSAMTAKDGAAAAAPAGAPAPTAKAPAAAPGAPAAKPATPAPVTKSPAPAPAKP